MNNDPEIYMKIHVAGDQTILAACDRSLIGKTLVRDDLQFKISEYFYGGDLVNDETFLMMISQVTSANVVGNHSVGLLIDSGIVNEDSIIKIEGVMHIQLYDVSIER